MSKCHRHTPDPGSGSGEPSVSCSWSSNPKLLMFWYGLVGPRLWGIGLRETIILAPYEGQWEPWSAPAPQNCPAQSQRAATLHRIWSWKSRYSNQVGKFRLSVKKCFSEGIRQCGVISTHCQLIIAQFWNAHWLIVSYSVFSNMNILVEIMI